MPKASKHVAKNTKQVKLQSYKKIPATDAAMKSEIGKKFKVLGYNLVYIRQVSNVDEVRRWVNHLIRDDRLFNLILNEEVHLHQEHCVIQKVDPIPQISKMDGDSVSLNIFEHLHHFLVE